MKIGIIGLGLIGGTIAKSLHGKYEIAAYDISPEVLAYAKTNGIIDFSYDDLSVFLAENQIIYICLYPGLIREFFAENRKYFRKNHLFIDVSGIKAELIKNLESLELDLIDIVFTHPVAGREKIGVRYADASIFKDANYIITPLDSNKPENIELVKKLAEDMGFKNISEISPEDHDDIIAYTSQLTHIISLALVKSVHTHLHTQKFIGDSYRDLTRIADINEILWSDLFLKNKNHLIDKIEKFKKALSEFEAALSEEDEEKLKALLVQARKIKQQIDKG